MLACHLAPRTRSASRSRSRAPRSRSSRAVRRGAPTLDPIGPVSRLPAYAIRRRMQSGRCSGATAISTGIGTRGSTQPPASTLCWPRSTRIQRPSSGADPLTWADVQLLGLDLASSSCRRAWLSAPLVWILGPRLHEPQGPNSLAKEPVGIHLRAGLLADGALPVPEAEQRSRQRMERGLGRRRRHPE